MKFWPFSFLVFNFGHFWFPCVYVFLSVNSERKWKRSHFNQRYTTFLLLLTRYFDVVLKTKSIMDKSGSGTGILLNQ